MTAKRQKELMLIIAHTKNSDILCAEWWDEGEFDLSDLSVQQNDGNYESYIMPIITTEELLTLPWEDDRSWH